MAVDLLAQPIAQRLELASGELGVQSAQFLVGRGEELGGVEIAQRVGGEIADQPGPPVNVLQHALRVAVGGTMPRYCWYFSFQAPGSRPRPGRRRSGPAPTRNDRMCRLYVASSASTRMNDGRTSLMANRSRRAALAQGPGKALWAAGKKCSQNGRLRPTRFSHSRDCDSWMPSETASPNGVPKWSRRQALLVDAVARFVQDAEEGLIEVVRVVAGGDAAVVRAELLQKGCAVTSSRPRSKSKPMAAAAAWPNDSWTSLG